MRFRLKPQFRVLFGKIVSLGFGLVLTVLSVVALVVGLLAYSSVKTFFHGLFIVGFQSIFSMTFSFFFTAFLTVATWFVFSLIVSVWKEFMSHRETQKASAGS